MSLVGCALIAACVLAIVHNLAPTHIRTKAFGRDWNMGARDTDPALEPPLAGRLERARVNYHENFVVFVALALLLIVTGRESVVGEAGAVTWLITRLIYLPLYAHGTPKVRTLVWTLSVLGLIAMAVDLIG